MWPGITQQPVNAGSGRIGVKTASLLQTTDHIKRARVL